MTVQGLYINLDRSPERRVFIEAQIRRLAPAWPYRRLAGTDGASLADRPGVKNKAELGCYLSHLNAISAAAGTRAWTHVLEDDAIISPRAASFIEAMTSQAAFGAYDVIFTNVMLQVGSEHMAIIRTLFDRVCETNPDGEVTRIREHMAFALKDMDFLLATSYLVNPRSAGALSAALRERLETRPFEPVDNAMARLCREGAFNMGCSAPFYTVPRFSQDSTIRDGITHCRLTQMVMEASLFADRSPAALFKVMEGLGGEDRMSVTSRLLTEAHRVIIARDMTVDATTA